MVGEVKSALVSRGGKVIRQAGNVLDQLVDGGRWLGIHEESIDLVGTASLPAFSLMNTALAVIGLVSEAMR